MSIDLNAIGEMHYDWVERMGWHNKTVLESLALIASEIGEAAAEAVGAVPTSEFGEELADIILRVADLAKVTGFDLNKAVEEAELLIPVSSVALVRITTMLIVYAEWTNTARHASLGPDFGVWMGKLVRQVLAAATEHGIDLEAAVQKKLLKNETRGTRGRLI